MNLVIGNSQLSHYFPKDYITISSRNVDLNYLLNNTWESVYLTFAEQRIHDLGIDFITPNYLYTLQIINALLKNTNKIICYTSCEIWNNLSGIIRLNTTANFFPINNEYVISKLLLWNKILELREKDDIYKKVIFVHPFYFNSIHRNEYFLFGKIFKSILNKEKITVGSLNFYRDMVHARFVVEKSIEAKSDIMMGAGRLFHVGDFIKDLYKINDLDAANYIKVNTFMDVLKPGTDKFIMAKVPWEYSYEDLLFDTQEDLRNYGNNNR